MRDKKIIVGAVAIIILVVAALLILVTKKDNNTPTEFSGSTTQIISAADIEQNKLYEKTQDDSQSNEDSNPNQNNNLSNTPTTKEPTQDDFYTAIKNSKGVDSNSFGIVNTVNPLKGWYVVTIKANNLEPAKVIFKQTNDPNNPLAIVAGPGTYFPNEILNNTSVPSEVRAVL